MLVCRVTLGYPCLTLGRAGTNTPINKDTGLPLFGSTIKKLEPCTHCMPAAKAFEYHSLVAETGEDLYVSSDRTRDRRICHCCMRSRVLDVAQEAISRVRLLHQGARMPDVLSRIPEDGKGGATQI